MARIITVSMTAAEYERYQEFKGAEATKKSTETQMKIQQQQARQLAESVEQTFGSIQNVGILGDSAARALELAREVLS